MNQHVDYDVNNLNLTRQTGFMKQKIARNNRFDVFSDGYFERESLVLNRLTSHKLEVFACCVT